jgi:ATP-binding protein involved in chromosome partitioning
MITVEDVLAALRAVQGLELGRDLVSLNMVTGVEIHEDTVRVTVNLTTPACPLYTDIVQQCRQALLSLPGVKQAEVHFTATVPAATFPNRQNLLP